MTDKALNSLLKSVPIIESTIKYYSAKNILVSISGGSDSDIIMDICAKISKDMHYVFFDTGIEYQATKEHIEYLSNRYNVNIKTIKPKQTIPNVVKKYGVPFLSKTVSDEICRLQKHNFNFSDHSFNEDYIKYSNCIQALRWYHNNFGENSRYNIMYRKYLKEFLIKYPPTFKISNKCCDKCKKDLAHKFMKDNNIVLDITGIRKYEGGARSKIISCYREDKNGIKLFTPLLFFTESDKNEYNKLNNIVNSDCYTKYGLKRTGCVGCPYGDYKNELLIIQKYEPKLYNLCINLFGESYNYTNMYYNFRDIYKLHDQNNIL